MSIKADVSIGDCRLILGDCLEVMAAFPPCFRVDAVVTDPPYGVEFVGKATKHTGASGGYTGGDNELGPSVVEMALKIAERAVIFPGSRLMFDYPRPYEIGCVYCPSGAGLGRWGFTTMHPMLYYGKGLPHTRQAPSGFHSFATSEPNGHPCPKPVKWMEWAIAKCSLPGHTILDPFMGSGTTGVACAKLGRKFIGIEIDPGYFDIACRRVEEAYRQPDMFIERPAPAIQTGMDL
jgi:DNA modification methylase